jgi:hypothetical protein
MPKKRKIAKKKSDSKKKEINKTKKIVTKSTETAGQNKKNVVKKVEKEFEDIFNENDKKDESIFEGEKKQNNSLIIALVVIVIVAFGWLAGKKLFAPKPNQEAETKAEEIITEKKGWFANLFTSKNDKIAEAVSKAAGEGMEVEEILNLEEKSGVYKFEIKFKGQEEKFTSYVTKDRKILFVQGLELEEMETPEAPKAAEVPKSARPKAELFVMTYCPYGLQMQKAYAPVMKLLAEKADMDVKFVNYIMHDTAERDENTLQYCLQKEQKDKYVSYLECFTTEGQESNKICLNKTRINKTQLNNCVDSTNKEFDILAKYDDEATKKGNFPFYSLQDELNVAYGVQGSPALIINGVEVSEVSRSPEAVKEAVCNAFEVAPEECNTVLDENQAAPGFGSEVGSAETDASCG